jgi:hypothetical protein
MIWFILIMVVVIIGASVLVGRAISKRDGAPMDRQSRITALKASGAMQNRKESRR